MKDKLERSGQYMKSGLVLEGGAMRGMYTAGIMDVFMDENIEFDGIIGVSAGAVFGVNYLSKQRGRVIRYSKKFNPDKNYISIGSLLRTGDIVNTEFAYGKVPRELDVFDDETFEKSGVPFYAVVTDMYTGMPKYIKIDRVFEQLNVLRASASMPFMSRPVIIGGIPCLDGGISDSIPFEHFAEMGYKKQVVILTRDINYVKKPLPPMSAKVYYRKYPVFAERLKMRYDNYNKKIERLKKKEENGDIFVIRPTKPIEIKKIERNPEKLQKVYELGVGDANAAVSAVKEFLSGERHI